MTADGVTQRLQALGDGEAARLAARYFKTGPGEYGEGDVFLGIRAAELHRLAREFQGLPLDECETLLQSPLHEVRALALMVLVRAFGRDEKARQSIHTLYLANTHRVNNWDLVDCSAPTLVGAYLVGRKRSLLDRLARSKTLWERRIAVVATLHFIRAGDFADILRLAERLLGDREDLIHKAAGWMLREVGKRDEPGLERFLSAHGRSMPRTMLRYAIERLDAGRREHYLKGEADS